jgi:hypothetical protein
MRPCHRVEITITQRLFYLANQGVEGHYEAR